MKKLTILLFSILISFNSYGEWTELVKIKSLGNTPEYSVLLGSIVYIDNDSIKLNDGFVKFLILFNYPYPKNISYTIDSLGDCNNNRHKVVEMYFHKQQLGTGITTTHESPYIGEWENATPESLGAGLLDYVCTYVEDRGEYKIAINYWLPRAEKGGAIAQDNLGTMYFNGTGVEQDYKEAVKWFTKAAEQGNASGQLHLGSAYANGNGVLMDLSKAKHWIGKTFVNPEPGARTTEFSANIFDEFELWKY
jgi:hypothetical protein